MQIITLRPAGADDMTPADYRDIYTELRANRPLRALVHAAGAAEGRIAYWSRYGNDPAAVPDLAGKNELRRLVGLPELDPPAGAVVAAAADPAAAVWQVGDGPADRVILLATPGPVTLHVNGAGPEVVSRAQNALYTDVHAPRSARPRKSVWRPALPPEWRSELERRGLTLRQIVEEALQETPRTSQNFSVSAPLHAARPGRAKRRVCA